MYLTNNDDTFNFMKIGNHMYVQTIILEDFIDQIAQRDWLEIIDTHTFGNTEINV